MKLKTIASDRLSRCISPAYRELQKELHARPNGYGGKGAKWAGVVTDLIGEYDAGSVLDYGCGQGSLVDRLRNGGLRGVRFADYDPAIPGKDQHPDFADLVVCTDVLEHVEPDRLAAVLSHLQVLARKAVFVVISTKASNKTLADGRNAHLTIESGMWWADRCHDAGFTVLEAPFRGRDTEWAAVLLP